MTCPLQPHTRKFQSTGKTVAATAKDNGQVIVEFATELWIWDARRLDTWTFVSLPVDEAEEIKARTDDGLRRGFGAIRVRVTIGGSTWKTSIFPDATRGSYVLPIKKSVRRAEALDPGDTAKIIVELIDH